jgi:manganese/zinc/iron transport system permease protein
MLGDLFYIFSDHTTRIVALGTMILGLAAGALGSFAVLRRQSLLGDAISHATLPGVVLAFMLTQSKSPLVLLIGAGLAGWVGTLCVLAIIRTTRIKSDAALGIILSVFFGLGLVFLTMVQRMPTASKAGLNKFLFGNAATLLLEDVYIIASLALAVLAMVVLFWKEFKLLTFDADFGQSIGLRVRFLDIFLTTLIVIAIVIGLKTVGVVLMSAMLVAPAAAARQWTDRLEVMVVLSAIIGALSGLAGTIVSSMDAHIPTGPVVVLFVSFFVFFSLFFAPNRGLIGDWMRRSRQRREMRNGEKHLEQSSAEGAHGS